MNGRRPRAVAALLALLLVTAAPVEEDTGRTEAAAWAVWISVPGQPVLQMGDVGAASGAVPSASATPISSAGSAPVAVRADTDAPQSSDSFGEWLDPTSSMSFAAGDAQARVDGSTAFGRASIGTASGSGFALADELFTWEQQEQLLGTWADANAAVFEALNEALMPLGQLLGPRNLVVPRLEPMAALGFVDVAGVEQVVSRAEGVTSDGFASASAQTAVSSVRMFGGFIEIEGISASAVAEQIGGEPTGRATATIDRLRIAGIEVELSEVGLLAGGNDLVGRELLQPVLDAALERLDAAGIRVRAADVRDVDGLVEATAFEVEIVTAQGMAIFSVGHAEAAAIAAGASAAAPPLTDGPDVPAPPAADPSGTTPAVQPGPSVGGMSPSLLAPPSMAVTDVGTLEPGPSATTDAPTPAVAPAALPAASRLSPLGSQAARSLSAAYVLLAAGLLAAMALPISLLARPRTTRRDRVLR